MTEGAFGMMGDIRCVTYNETGDEAAEARGTYHLCISDFYCDMAMELGTGVTINIGSCPDPEPEEVLPGIEDGEFYEGPSPNIEGFVPGEDYDNLDNYEILCTTTAECNTDIDFMNPISACCLYEYNIMTLSLS